MFSTLKYVNAPNFEKFREVWNAKFLSGFVVPSKVFEGLTGKFPIGFLIWETNQLGLKSPIKDVRVNVLDKDIKPIGDKSFYNLPSNTFLNVWLDRPKANKTPILPLKNAISPYVSKPRVTTWSDQAIAYMYCGVNDLQHAEQQTVIYSSVYGGGNGFYITPDNLIQSSVIFSVRRLVKPTWLNDRDQFLQPNTQLSEEFENDCLVWMLFNRCNRTASADQLRWDDKDWSLVSHFIPFSEDEVKAPSRFESHFMIDFVRNRKFSDDANNVLLAGRKLWEAYFSSVDEKSVREEFKLNRSDVGWYQVRKALEVRNSNGVNLPVDFSEFSSAYDNLSNKLSPQVYELGFLR
jgi:hypothetical protein